MLSKNARSSGGLASAKAQRERALAAYNASPNKCKTCGQVITVPDGAKVSEVRKKTFCTRSCSTTHANRTATRRFGPPKKSRSCSCGAPLSGRRKLCPSCRPANMDMTKGDLFKRRSSWQSARSTIQRLARVAFDRTGQRAACVVCGYHKHIEVAHRQAVAAFPDAAKISEINDPNNLVPMCRNHHWEQENGLITLAPLGGLEPPTDPVS